MFVVSMAASASILLAGLTVAAQQVLPGHVPEAIGRFHLQPQSRLAGTNRLDLVLQLPLRNGVALTNFLAQLYDPASPNYHRYLTPDQFTERFGPTTNDYQAVINFARQHGFEITGTHNSRLIVDVRGQVSNIETALHVTLQRYQHPTETRTFYAPATEPTVDADVPIWDIGGLSDYARPRSAAHARGIPGTASSLANGTGLDGLYMSKDLRNAYLPGSSLAGSGQKIGLFETDGYYASDIALYEKFAGLTNVPLQNVLVDGFSGTPGSGNFEVALDIEMAIAMAPALAGVVVYECPGSYSQGLDVINDMATNTQINQFSSSIGYTGANPYNYFDQVLQKMMAQGQSYFQASGDGDAWTAAIWVPAASPYVTSVGGTSLTTSNNGTGYLSEKVWNIGSYTTNKIVSGAWSENGNGYWGSGGGVSGYYSIPDWQTNLNMTANLGSTNARNIPDVAMPAIYLYLVYNDGTTNSYAVGTSAATPLWAGFTALINQQAANSSKYPVGFLNAAVYPMALQTNYTNIFHDITSGNNFSSSSPANYPAVSGYDLCTGLGTPRGTNLIDALVSSLPTEAPAITAPPVSATVAVGGTASFSLTAGGVPPLSYFWRLNGAFMAGQTNDTFTTNNVQLVNSGQQFTCVVSNPFGSVTSQVATLTVTLSAAQAPVFAASLAGTNLLVTGTNGVEYGTYTLLTSTSLLRPVAAWTPVSTNVLTAGGSFKLTATNAVNPRSPQQFYLLKVQ